MSEMTMNQFQELASRTSRRDGDKGFAISGLGIAGEAGEVADHIKKVVGHGHPLDRADFIKELGDVLWYVADIASHIGVDLEVIAWANIEKLKKRYPDGFSSERSINREE